LASLSNACASFSPSLTLAGNTGPIRGKNTPKFVAIFPSFPHLKKPAFLKYLTYAQEFCKQIRLLKRRFHAASLRGSCGSPLGSTSNPKKTQELRKREPRKSERGKDTTEKQYFRKHRMWVK
jgi:hypothetical protein